MILRLFNYNNYKLVHRIAIDRHIFYILVMINEIFIAYFRP